MRSLRLRIGSQSGFLLMEVLVVLLMAAVAGLSITYSTVLTMQTRTHTVHNSVALQIGLEQMETLATIDPSTLDASDNEVTTVNRAGMSFARTIGIVINADSSRTITVTVADENSYYNATGSVTNTFPLWGSL